VNRKMMQSNITCRRTGQVGFVNGQLATLYYPLQSIVASSMQAVAWGFILAAIFGRRDEP